MCVCSQFFIQHLKGHCRKDSNTVPVIFCISKPSAEAFISQDMTSKKVFFWEQSTLSRAERLSKLFHHAWQTLL